MAPEIELIREEVHSKDLLKAAEDAASALFSIYIKSDNPDIRCQARAMIDALCEEYGHK